MHIFEFVTVDDAVNNGHYDINKDEINGRRPDDTRKKEIKLRDINRLKKMRAQNKLEALKRQDLLTVMYGGPGDDAGGPGGFGSF